MPPLTDKKSTVTLITSAATSEPDTTARALRSSNQQGWLEKLGEAAIDPNDSPELRLKKALLLLASGLVSVGAFVWVGIYALLGLKVSTSIPLGYQVASALLLVYFLRTKNFAHYRFLQLALFLFVPFAIQWSMGSFVSSSGIVLLALIAPIGAMIVYGQRESIPWFLAYAVLTVVSGAFDYYLTDGSTAGMPMKTIAVFFVLNFTILSTVVYLLLRYFLKQKDQYQAELAEHHELVRIEREKSELLLTNLLPAHVAERLKNQSSTIADGFSDVTVMFADIVNFTRLSEQLTPKEVVSFLNELFTRLDHLAAKHQLDKIKTIGDSYMVVGGLNHGRAFYVEGIADMALELQSLMRHDRSLGRYNVAFHIGIASGPAVAGVIGATRFMYDLWGDTVNVASRITSEAPGGTIVVDKTTFGRLVERYDFGEPRTAVFKGKGEMSVYQLIGRKAGAAANA